MLKFLLGAAIGYVLGAKAGHERYEQLKRTYERVSDHPAVQGAAGSCGRASRRPCTAATRADLVPPPATVQRMLELVGIRGNLLLDVVGKY